MSEHSELPWRFGNTDPEQIMVLTNDGQYVCNVQVRQCGGGAIAALMEKPRRERAAYIVLAANNYHELVRALQWISDQEGAHPANMVAVARHALAAIKEPGQ